MPPPRRLYTAPTRELSREPEEIRQRFNTLTEPRDLADLLELDWAQLYFITTRASERYAYREFTIPKATGEPRRIQVPHPTIRILQRKVLEILNLVYTPHAAAYGFVRQRGVVDNARCHVGKRLVLNFDLEHFFTNITFLRVRGAFIKRLRLEPKVATLLARLCCNTGDTPDHLPQGGPTSPMLANMICHSFDYQMVRIAREYGMYYTRYADDITLSSNRRSFPGEIAEVYGHSARIGPKLMEILDHNSLPVNHAKTRIHDRSVRQEITGLTSNRRVNVERSLIKELRGMLHAWRTHGYEAAETDHQNRRGDASLCFGAVVSGKLAYLRQVRGSDDRLFRRLYVRAQDLAPERFRELPPLGRKAESLKVAAEDLPTVTPTDSKEVRRTYFGRMLASTRGCVWLIDPHLELKGPLQDAVLEVDPARVTEVRMLATGRPDGGPNKVRELEAKLRERGISVEFRVNPTANFHDRWIADERDCVQFGGPLKNVVQETPTFSHNSVGRRPELLDLWWREGRAL